MIALIVWFEKANTKKYKVKITFCDTRPPRTFEVEASRQPGNYDIQCSRDFPTPRYAGLLNVCEITSEEIK